MSGLFNFESIPEMGIAYAEYMFDGIDYGIPYVFDAEMLEVINCGKDLDRIISIIKLNDFDVMESETPFIKND